MMAGVDVSGFDPERAERLRRLREQPPPPELPPDPDLDHLPREIDEADGELTLVGWDRETGERFEGPVAPIDLARGLADRRRLEDDEP
jgi:hypothetical protein